jgi:hypothetical protein
LGGKPGVQPGQGQRIIPNRPSAMPSGSVGAIHRDTPRAMPSPSGAPAGHTQLAFAPGRGTTIVHNTINNTTIINNVSVHNRVEITRGGYWWHNEGGVRYCHHYDQWGYHWYGWWFGGSYFWTRYYYDRWWWYDPYWHRWCYWHDDYWWWENPYNVGVVYVYIDNSYYSYDDAQGGAVLKPDPTQPIDPPPQQPAQPADQLQTYYSKDGTRMVQITGQNKDAYLYDTATPPSFEAVWLGSGVTEVRFQYSSDASGTETLKELLVLKDNGSWDLFDGNGYLESPSGQTQTEAAPPQTLVPPTSECLDTLKAFSEGTGNW